MPLKASPTSQALLLRLQALDTRVNQLDHRAKMLPELAILAGLESESGTLRGELQSANGAVEDAQRELKRIESDVSVVEARITRDTDRLQSSTSVKDVAGLESELAGLTRRQLDLEEIELGVMERLDAREAASRALQAQSTDLTARVAAARSERDASLGVIVKDRTDAAAERTAMAAGIPADLLALYEKQRARYGAGASLLRGGVSNASGLKLNEYDMQMIRDADPDDVILCPESSAILVRTAESGL